MVSKKGVDTPGVIYTSVFIIRVGAPDDHATATLSGESILVAHSRCRMIDKQFQLLAILGNFPISAGQERGALPERSTPTLILKWLLIVIIKNRSIDI